MMRNEPGVAYLCGPKALTNLLLSQGVGAAGVQVLEGARSGSQGFTLAQVAELATQAKQPYQLVFRAIGQPIPVPAVVHWKVNHFAAIVGEQNGRFHIQDPTFGTDLWVTRGAIESESSGYFLVLNSSPGANWRVVSSKEAGQVRGMGYTGSTNPTSTTSQDDTTSDDNNQTDTSNENRNGDDSTTGDNGNCGLCGYGITEMVVSIRLKDTPVGYQPPKGPVMFTTLTYNQREASQPATFSWFNVSPKWTLNWLSYVQDDPAVPGSNVTRYVGGGGSIALFRLQQRHRSIHDRKHEMLQFSQEPLPIRSPTNASAATAASKSFRSRMVPAAIHARIFLTQIIDPAGNAATLNYDNQLRLTSILDATGRTTTFSYDLQARPLLVTSITDPFARSRQLTYDASGRLSKITDVLGLTSQFTYDASSLINALTTPYGTTTFTYGDNGNQRFAMATDPLGKTERVEYNQGVSSIPFSDPPSLVPQGLQLPFNAYLNGRNTYIWDKHAYAVAGGDYTKARIKHWTHLATNTNITANTIESIKNPLENRIWFNYPGQVGNSTGLGTAISGTLDKRTIVAKSS